MIPSEPPGATLKDPVCGKKVSPKSPFRTRHEGREYFFCSRRCRDEFQANPKTFITAPAHYFKCPEHPGLRQAEPGKCPCCERPLEAVRPKWVCPYHPKVLHDEPGVCPIYGMPLIPEPPGRFYACALHPQESQLEPGKCPRCGLELQASWAPVAKVRIEWFCPGHPKAVSPEPGNCPECRRKLEPRGVPGNAET